MKLNELSDILELKKMEAKKRTPNYHLRLSDENLIQLAKLTEEYHESKTWFPMPYWVRLFSETSDVNVIHEQLEKASVKVFGMEIHAEDPRHGRIR